MGVDLRFRWVLVCVLVVVVGFVVLIVVELVVVEDMCGGEVFCKLVEGDYYIYLFDGMED